MQKWFKNGRWISAEERRRIRDEETKDAEKQAKESEKESVKLAEEAKKAEEKATKEAEEKAKKEADAKAKADAEANKENKGTDTKENADGKDDKGNDEAPKMVDHKVTKEDLKNNPELKDEGIKVGDIIQIPETPESDK